VGFSESGKSDADLVHEALAGDREPLGELLRRHWDTAVFLAARVLGSPELARDAAQEAAIAAMTGGSPSSDHSLRGNRCARNGASGSRPRPALTSTSRPARYWR
jgi:hypothetical protein